MEETKLNYCPNCHVSVDPSLADCPLCRHHLTDAPIPNAMYSDTRAEPGPLHKHGFYEDLLVFLSVVFITTSVVLNILYWQGKPWCLAVGTAILYVWIVLWTYVFRRPFFGAQLVLQVCGLMAMFISFDIAAGWTGWSISRALPIMLCTCNVLIDIHAGTYKSRWKDNLMYALLFAALGFLPMFLYLTHVTNALVPMALAAISSTVSILGILRFAVRTLVQEMKRRLHL